MEQFSISSDDSIWDETAYTTNDNFMKEKTAQLTYNPSASGLDHSYFSLNNHQAHKDTVLLGVKSSNTNNRNEKLATRSTNIPHLKTWGGLAMKTSNKKGAKRLSECENHEEPIVKKCNIAEPPVLLSKWLESAARFVPRDSFISWSTQNCSTWHNNVSRGRQKVDGVLRGRHREEELDAAEALTSLSHQHFDPNKYN